MQFIIKPSRKIFYKLLDPYFYRLFESINQRLAHRFNTTETRIEAAIKDIEAMAHRFNTIEMRIEAAIKEIEAMAHRFNTIEMRNELAIQTRIEASSKEIKAMAHRFNTIESGNKHIEVAMQHRFNNIEARIDTANRDMKAMLHRFNTNESTLKDHYAQICGIREHTASASYSQIGEDRIFVYIFEHMGIPLNHIRYLDIGSAYPSGHNNTYLFYKAGASGCLVEADPDYFESYATQRPRDIAINAAIVPESLKKNNGSISFFRTADRGWSTVLDAHLDFAKSQGKADSKTVEITVQAMTINDLIKMHFSDSPIDLLSIDIEGLDLEVIKEINFSKTRPKAIIAENNFEPSKNIFIPSLKTFLEDNGYILYASTFVNSIFIDSDLLKLIKY